LAVPKEVVVLERILSFPLLLIPLSSLLVCVFLSFLFASFVPCEE
jgi:hypothetical protein